MLPTDDRIRRFYWDYDRKELLADGVVHVVGIIVALIGAIVLIIICGRLATGWETASVSIYLAGLLTAFCLSAAYNMSPPSPCKWLLRQLDHSAIYLLIAGTYTPFIVQLKAAATSISLLLGIWVVAAAGIAVKIALPGRFDRFAIVLYLLLGWSGLLVYEAVSAGLATSTLWLLAIGGVLYSAGVVFHLLRGLRYQNAIWHGFVLIAAVFHYMAVLDCVALTRI